MRGSWALIGVILTAGCVDLPDEPGLLGRYNVQIYGIIGCGNDPALVEWMQGPLEVGGIASAQSFDFGEGYFLTGSSGANGAFSATNVLTLDGESVPVTLIGTAEGEPGSRTLDGSLSTTLSIASDTDGDTSCTIDALFTASQLAE